MQINAIKFRQNQSDEPITYKFSQSSGKFANFQSIFASPPLLKNISAAIDFALTGKTTTTIFDAVLQTSDHAGNTWIVHRTLSKVRLVKNGTEQSEEQLSEMHAAFFEHLDDVDGGAPSKRTVAIANKKIVLNKGKLVAVDPETLDAPGGDVRGVLEDQIAAITAGCVASTGLHELTDPGIMIKLSQDIEPLYASYREVCSQYQSFKDSKSSDQDTSIADLDRQLEIIRDLELLSEKFLTPNFSVSKIFEDLATIDGKIAEMAAVLAVSPADSSSLIKDFRKPVEALARLEMFAKLVRASQGARKYCEQKIEPFYKSYLEFADRNLASNREIAAELESCLSTLALKLKTDIRHPRESGQSLKTWFEKFKSKSNEETGQTPNTLNQAAQNDFDTARLAIEYAVSQLNEMANHLKIAVTQHESALGAVDESHESLVAQYNQLRNHWIATAKACGMSADIDSTHMIKLIVAHGRLAVLIERRNQLEAACKQQEQDFMQIEDLIVRWRDASGSQKSLDLSSPSIILREARDILRYKEPRVRRRDLLRETQNSRNANKAFIDHLKTRREEIIAKWNSAFAAFGMKAPPISDKYNRELLKRASIIRGLALAWSSTPGIEAIDRGASPFTDSNDNFGIVVYDTTEVKLENQDRLEFLRTIESATGGELRLLLIADEQLSQLIAALSIGTASRVVQAPAPASAKQMRPTPVAKIIRAEKGVRSKTSPEQLSERAQQMLEMLSPRK